MTTKTNITAQVNDMVMVTSTLTLMLKTTTIDVITTNLANHTDTITNTVMIRVTAKVMLKVMVKV